MGAAWLGAGLTGLSFLSGLFGKKSHNEVDKTTTNTVNYDPKSAAFKDFLMNMYQGNLENDQGFGDAYKTNGLQSIYDQAGLASKNVDNSMTSRGLTRTTAGANSDVENSYRTGGSISRFLSNAPLVLDQRRQGLLNSAGGFFSSLPTGSTQHTTGYDDSGMGGGVAGGIQGGTSGLAGFLGQLSAQGALDKILKGMGGSSGSSSGSGSRGTVGIDW